MKFDRFSFNLEVFPKIPRILYPFWWVIWELLFILYLIAFLFAKLFVLIRWIFTPSNHSKKVKEREKEEEKEKKRDVKTRK